MTELFTQKNLEDPLDYLPASHTVEYKEHQVIYNQAKLPLGLYLVIGGLVKVSRIAETGRRCLMDIYQPDDFFGESSLLGLEATTDEAVALQDAKLMNWTAMEIQDMILKRPRLAVALTQLLIQRAIEYNQRIVSFSRGDIPNRLVSALLRFGNRLGNPEGQGSIRVSVPLTHQLLAECVGTSREAVTHHMNMLRRQGYLRYSRKGLILFPSAIQQWLRQNADLGAPDPHPAVSDHSKQRES